jgi:hypothetical protein
MLIDTACKALRTGKLLSLHYDGYSRSVEVHACGYTKQGHAVIRAWQISGGSASGERQGWKLMRLDEGSSVAIADLPSAAPRKGFKLGDPAMARIICEVGPTFASPLSLARAL